MDHETLKELWRATLSFSEDAETLPPDATYKLEEEGVVSPVEGSVTPVTMALDSSASSETGEFGPVEGGNPASGSASYNLLSLIGRGGMGVVHRARQRSLARDVAVKRIIAEQATPALRNRFISEALVAGGLDHPNIVPVHELGETPQGEVFMAMKLVGGTSWKEILHPSGKGPEPVSPEERRRHLDLLLSVGNAVAFAHANNIVHRDLKPENVMVGEFGEVLLMDWGLACDVSPDAKGTFGAPHRSTIRSPAGTPCYMAPELAEGRGSEISARTDVYLLGAILHEIVTGVPPHQGQTLFEVLRNASVSKPPLFGQDVPDPLKEICARALRRDPEDRHASVKEFQEDIQSYLEHEESLRLGSEAGRNLTLLMEPGRIPREERYQLFGEVLSRFGEALHLWDDNKAALRGQAQAATLYADEAIHRRDLGLAYAQVSLLKGNSFTSPEKLQSIEVALKAGESGRLRAFITSIVLLVVFAGIFAAITELNDRRIEEAKSLELKGQSQTEITRAWEKLSAGDLKSFEKDLASIIHGETAQAADGEELARLERARLAYLWSQGRLSANPELWSWNEELRTGWLNEPLLEGTWIQNHLEAFQPAGNSKTGARTRRTGSDALGLPFDLLLEAADTELDPRALMRAFELMDSLGRKEVEASYVDVARPLSRAFLFRRARDAALYRGDVSGAKALGKEITPFSLSSAPFGRQRVPGGATTARIIQDDSGSWMGLDPQTREVRFRIPALNNRGVAASTIPVEDGSVIYLSPGQALRIDGASGDVLGRFRLDGVVLFAYPDPSDRSRLVVISQTTQVGGGTQETVLREGQSETPIFDSVGEGMCRIPTKPPVDTFLEWLEDQEVESGESYEEDEREEAARHRVRRGLEQEILRDPENPHLRLALLGRMDGKNDPEARDALALSIASLPGLGVFDCVQLGVEVEKAGHVEIADRLYERGATRFLDLGGNPALCPLIVASPALYLRKLGGELFEAGNVPRSLELVEIGRRYSSYLEMDHHFYRKYVSWLEKKGERDTETYRQMERRVSESAVPGGVFFLPAELIIGSDLALFICSLMPILFFVLLGRLWWNARDARISDLYSIGLRSRQKRLLAFLVRPVDRLKHTFLAYSPRGARFMIVAIGITMLAVIAGLSSSVATIGRLAAMSSWVGCGLSGNERMIEHLQDRLEEGGADVASLRLLAEGLRARGEKEEVRSALMEILRRDPEDGVARNNLAVLDFEEGDRLEASRVFADLSRRTDELAGVARWNRARLESEPVPALDPWEVTHQDFVAAANLESGELLWAHGSYSDLLSTILTFQGILKEAKNALVGFLVNGIGGVRDSLLGEGSSPLDVFGFVGAYLMLIFVGLSLLWLPFPVRQLQVEEDQHGQSHLLLSRVKSKVQRYLWLRHVGGVGISLVIPGAWDLFYRSAAFGAVQLFVLVVCFTLRKTIVFGGILSAIAIPAVNMGYFPDEIFNVAYPEAAGWGRIATVAFFAMMAINVPVTGWRAYRRFRPDR